MPDPITVAGAIEKANALKSEQTELRKRTTANRKLCNMLVENGLASEDEKAAIVKLYPPHEKAEKPADAPSPTPATDARDAERAAQGKEPTVTAGKAK